MNNEEVEKNSQNKKIRGGKDGEGRSRRKRGSRRRRKWRLIWRMGGKSADSGGLIRGNRT